MTESKLQERQFVFMDHFFRFMDHFDPDLSVAEIAEVSRLAIADGWDTIEIRLGMIMAGIKLARKKEVDLEDRT